MYGGIDDSADGVPLYAMAAVPQSAFNDESPVGSYAPSFKEPLTVRKEFPESWIFEDLAMIG